MMLAMMRRKSIHATLLGILIFISTGCFLQPINEVIREFNFIDMDAPAVRLARPVEAEILVYDEAKEAWVPAGKGLIPAGAYIRGRAPKENIDEGVD